MKKRNSFELVVLLAGLVAQVATAALPPLYLNEWMFDQDVAGRTLSEAVNSGTDGAVFSADSERITQTDGSRRLICNNNVPTGSPLWTSGAVLTADVIDSVSNEVRFLRYDFEYDMTSPGNRDGTLLALAFSDGTATNLAGVAFQYDQGALPSLNPPAGVLADPISTAALDFTGKISVIAGVDLSNQTLSVWYNLSGENTFGAAPNAVVSNLNLTSIQDLVFRANGDFVASSENQCVRIDNIRTAATWEEISAQLTDLTQSPALTVSLSDSLGGGMVVGQTNLITVTIANSAGLASNVVSTLVHDGGTGLTILSSSNAPAMIVGGRSVEQTFWVRAESDGPYVLTAQATAAGGISSAPGTLLLDVGKAVRYDSYRITNDVGGLVSGVVEPGESFDLIVTSINRGAVPVAGITNSLVPDSTTYFPTIFAVTSDTYGYLARGNATSTVYHVTCSASTPNGLHTFSVANRTEDLEWVDTFQLDVLRLVNLSASTNSLTLVVIEGRTNSAQVALSNTGNVSTPFSVSYNAAPVYALQLNAETRVPFNTKPADFYPDTVLTNWSGTTTVVNIGFNFLLDGGSYTNVTVDQAGSVSLGNRKLSPFAREALVAPSQIRYQKTADRLVVAWGVDGIEGNATECQVWLNSDGTVQYLYEYGTWPLADANGLVGAVEFLSSKYSYTPGTVRMDGLLFTPKAWMTCSPSSGTVDGFGATQTLTVTADASLTRGTSTNVFTVTVSGEGSSTLIDVTVIVRRAGFKLDVPTAFSFTGPAGSISPAAYLTVTNSGDSSLTYVISDNSGKSGGYITNAADYIWSDVPVLADTVLETSDLDQTPVEIGFPFVYFGTAYTSLTVGVNGTLTMGTSTVNKISVFAPPVASKLLLDENSSVRVLRNASGTRFVVLWENLAQTGGGQDQTFEAVLYRNGKIDFNYKQMGANWSAGLIQLVNSGSTTVKGSLSNATTTVTTTNYVTTVGYVDKVIGNATIQIETNRVTATNIVTTYTAAANGQVIEFIPKLPQVITASPIFGTIPAGQTADIALVGDARSLTPGGSRSVSTNTTLTFSYGTTNTATCKVTFTASNSVDAVFSAPELAVAAWGDANPKISVEVNADGTRTLSWPSAHDSYSRTYQIWYTTDLNVDWVELQTPVLTDVSSWVDDTHKTTPVVFYKITVR